MHVCRNVAECLMLAAGCRLEGLAVRLGASWVMAPWCLRRDPVWERSVTTMLQENLTHFAL
jgi:hypothetical protein